MGSACSDGSGDGCGAEASGAITARAARSRSAARISARVAGAAVVGMAAVAGSGVVPVLTVPVTAASVLVAPVSSGFPVGGIRWVGPDGVRLAWCARLQCGRGAADPWLGTWWLPLNAFEVSCRVRTRPSGRLSGFTPPRTWIPSPGTVGPPPPLPRVWRIPDCGRARRQSGSGPADIRVALRRYMSRKVKSH